MKSGGFAARIVVFGPGMEEAVSISLLERSAREGDSPVGVKGRMMAGILSNTRWKSRAKIGGTNLEP